MSKVLAGYILNVAAAYDASYDREASDKAVEAARVRARESVKLRATTAPKVADVTSSELMGRDIYVDGVKTKVIKCLISGVFRTEGGFEGSLKNVRRRGRGFVYVTDTYREEAEQQRVEEAVDEIIDFSKFQTKTIWQCAEEVVPHIYRTPVYLLLQTAWNDALQWANEVSALRDADGSDTHDFRFLIPSAAQDDSDIDFQLSAQDELSAAFKLGQLFNENLSIETVRLFVK